VRTVCAKFRLVMVQILVVTPVVYHRGCGIFQKLSSYSHFKKQ